LIVSIQSKVVQGPWGGGNLFTSNLVDYLLKNNNEVIDNLYDKNIDVILMTDPLKQSISINYSFNEIKRYKKYINPGVKIVHRINECDERKNTNYVNKEILTCNKIADTTVFVSEWLKGIYEQLGLLNNNRVILSGSNKNIFNDIGKIKWNNKSNVKIVTHHWGTNINKGFKVYEYIDKLIDENNLNNVEFTYIGNLPSKFMFKSSNYIEPLQGSDLANELKKHDIYLTASINEPSGNHHIEGAQCGLPLLFINSGGVAEYCKDYGLAFDDIEQFRKTLYDLIDNYDFYFKKIKDYPHNSEKMCNDYMDVFKQIVLEDNNLQNKNIYSNFYKIIYSLNKLKNKII